MSSSSRWLQCEGGRCHPWRAFFQNAILTNLACRYSALDMNCLWTQDNSAARVQTKSPSEQISNDTFLVITAPYCSSCEVKTWVRENLDTENMPTGHQQTGPGCVNNTYRPCLVVCSCHMSSSPSLTASSVSLVHRYVCKLIIDVFHKNIDFFIKNIRLHTYPRANLSVRDLGHRQTDIQTNF